MNRPNREGPFNVATIEQRPNAWAVVVRLDTAPDGVLVLNIRRSKDGRLDVRTVGGRLVAAYPNEAAYMRGHSVTRWLVSCRSWELHGWRSRRQRARHRAVGLRARRAARLAVPTDPWCEWGGWSGGPTSGPHRR